MPLTTRAHGSLRGALAVGDAAQAALQIPADPFNGGSLQARQNKSSTASVNRNKYADAIGIVPPHPALSPNGASARSIALRSNPAGPTAKRSAGSRVA